MLPFIAFFAGFEPVGRVLHHSVSRLDLLNFWGRPLWLSPPSPSFPCTPQSRAELGTCAPSFRSFRSLLIVTLFCAPLSFLILRRHPRLAPLGQPYDPAVPPALTTSLPLLDLLILLLPSFHEFPLCPLQLPSGALRSPFPGRKGIPPTKASDQCHACRAPAQGNDGSSRKLSVKPFVGPLAQSYHCQLSPMLPEDDMNGRRRPLPA